MRCCRWKTWLFMWKRKFWRTQPFQAMKTLGPLLRNSALSEKVWKPVIFTMTVWSLYIKNQLGSWIRYLKGLLSLHFADLDDISNRVDFIICLGGDGTLLYASSLFQVFTCPYCHFETAFVDFYWNDNPLLLLFICRRAFHQLWPSTWAPWAFWHLSNLTPTSLRSPKLLKVTCLSALIFLQRKHSCFVWKHMLCSYICICIVYR